MRLADLTIKQLASICKKYNKNVFDCDVNCPLFMSSHACCLARNSVLVMDIKISEKEIDPSLIKQEIDERFYMNRFMEVS